MLKIQNTALQGFNIPFETPTGVKYAYIGPKSTLVLPSSYSSNVLNNLVRRKIVRVTRVTK